MAAAVFDRYLAQWELLADGRAIQTPSSCVLPVRRRGGAAMLKIVRPGSDEARGGDVLRYFGGDGAVRLFESDGPALLMERADDDLSLTVMALAGGDDAAADILGGTLARLHAPRTAPPPEGLPGLRRWFRALFARAAEQPILARCGDVARDLLAGERESVVLHGDLHHANVLHSGRGWLAIDPKGLLGEPAYEVANLLCNPAPHGEIVHDPGRMRRLAELYAARLGLDIGRVLGFALVHAGLSACWSIEDGEDPSYRLTCAEVLAPLVRPPSWS